MYRRHRNARLRTGGLLGGPPTYFNALDYLVIAGGGGGGKLLVAGGGAGGLLTATNATVSARPQPARDDPAQNFARAAAQAPAR